MNKRKLIFISVQLVIISLLFSATAVAWFFTNRQVKSGRMGMTIQSVSDVATLSCYALRYDGTIGVVCYKIGEDEENGEVSQVEMTEFDWIFRDRLVNTPLIYVVELSNVPDTSGYYINVRIPCSEKFVRVGGTATNDFTDDGNTQFNIQRFISNIVSVKIACGGQIDELTPTTSENYHRVENNITVFSNASSLFRALTSGDAVGQFATVTNETAYSKTTSVQLRLSQADYHDYIYTAENDQGIEENRLMLYIQFDYDQGLMNAYIDHMLEETEGDVSFANDFGVIQILVRNGGN